MADESNLGEEGLPPPMARNLPLSESVPLQRVRFIIDRSRPIVGQVVKQIASLLVSGTLSVEERLPTHSEAAELLGVGTNTVAAIYAILVRHGIATSMVSAGTHFTPQAQREASRYLVSSDATSLIHRARALGLAEDEIVGVFLAALARVENEGTVQESPPLD